MKIKDFTLGLNTRLSSRLLQPGQATVCKNIDPTSLDLKPIKALGVSIESNPPGTVYFDSVTGEQASSAGTKFFDFRGELYKVTDGKLLRFIYSDWYRVGIVHDKSRMALSANVVSKDLGTLSTLDTTESLPNNYLSDTEWTIPFDNRPGLSSGDSALERHTKQEVFLSRIQDFVASKLGTKDTPADVDGNEFYPSSIFAIVLFIYRAQLYNLWSNEGIRGAKLSLQYSNIKRETKYYYDATEGKVTKFKTITATINLSWTNLSSLNIRPSGSTDSDAYYEDVFNSSLPYANDILTNNARSYLEEDIVKHKYNYMVTAYTNDYESGLLSDIVTVDAYAFDAVNWVYTLTSDYHSEHGPIPAGVSVYLYRSGNGATLPQAISSLPGLQSFNETDYDLNKEVYLNSFKVFDTVDVQAPPIDISSAITIANRVVLVSGNELFVSDLGNEDNFPVVNTVKMHRDVVGVAESYNGLLVFFKYETYLVTIGQNGRYIKSLVSAKQGCKAKESIQHIKGTPLWLSYEGLCVYENSKINVVTTNTLLNDLKLFNPTASVAYNDMYIASMGAVCYVSDFRFGKRTDYFFYMPQAIESFYVKEDKLYFVVSGDTKEFSASDSYLSYDYKTGLLTDGDLTEVKSYDNFYFFKLDDRPVRCRVYNEKEEKIADIATSEQGLIDFKCQSAKKRAYGISFKFTGTGAVAELEYKIEGRKNGR